MHSSKGLLSNKNMSKNTPLEGTNSPRLPAPSAGAFTISIYCVIVYRGNSQRLPPRKGAPTHAGAGLISELDWR